MDDDFDAILEKLKVLKDKKLISAYEQKYLAELCKPDILTEELNLYPEYVTFKCYGINDRELIQDFVNTSLYPYNIGGESNLQLR